MRLSIPLEEDQFDSSSMYSTIDSLGQPGAVRKGRVIRPFLSGFDPDFVVHGNSQLLLTAEVMLGRLDGHVPEQELDLVELSAGQMTEAGTGAPPYRFRLPQPLSWQFTTALSASCHGPISAGLVDCPKQDLF
jgi:hypothetical protein